MDYFKSLQELLQMEKEEDRKQFEKLSRHLSINDKRENGSCWYPVAIRDTETGYGDYITIEIERTTHQDLMHQFRFGMTAALFSQYDAEQRLEGTIAHLSGNRMKLALRVDELPDWTRRGKLGVDAVFDENSYTEMESALRAAAQLADNKKEGRLVQVLTGRLQPEFEIFTGEQKISGLNEKQKLAVEKILAAQDLAIVHGPPGTGKTTTLVQAISLLSKKESTPVLVTAPSNAAVDLLTERLSAQGLNVVRIGNPARVNEQQLSLTLDSRISNHASARDIQKLKKQAAGYRNLAQKYKRSFGPAEREQRKALFNEARNISREVERTEQYITEDILSRAQVITSTLVGASHYTIRHLKFNTVVIDEAGQSLEPACWIPIIKAKKLVMAGDHCQLPPTIKSSEAARGLSITLMEKNVALHPDAVVLLQEQYRMHDTIMQFPSREFYHNQLIAHVAVAGHLVFEGDRPFHFIDTAGCGYEEQLEGTGISNKEEAAFLFQQLQHYLKEIDRRKIPFPSIAVISPYRHQVELLKDELKDIPAAYQPFIQVNTIDSFQGQERDVVYISLTRSNADSTIGFLSDIRRVNVAMTRARKKLVMIGDTATLSQFPFYADLVAYAQQQHAYQSAWELMEY